MLVKCGELFKLDFSDGFSQATLPVTFTHYIVFGYDLSRSAALVRTDSLFLLSLNHCQNDLNTSSRHSSSGISPILTCIHR